MSIISTVYVPEGIAMAADSRLTRTITNQDGLKESYTLSDNSQKLFLIKNNKIGISCCGNAIIAGKSVGDFIRQFEIDKILESDRVDEVAHKLNDHTKKLHGNGVIYHVCGYDGDNPYFYRIVDGCIKRMNISDDGIILYGASWNGQITAISNLLLGNNSSYIDWDFMQLKDGIDLAEFLVDITIKYQRFTSGLATCGGDIDLLVITKDYAKFIKHKVLNP